MASPPTPPQAGERKLAGHSYADITATDNVRQRIGDHVEHNYYRNSYTPRQRRSDETLREDERSPLLLEAAADGQTVRIKHLLRLGINLDFRDHDNLTALHHAVLSGHEDTVQAVLEAGANVNAHSSVGGSPLCLAALKSCTDIVSLLLRYRASVRRFEGTLGSPLHCACGGGSSTIVTQLIQHGAEIGQWSKVSTWPHPVVGALFGRRYPRMASAYSWPCQPVHVAVSNNNLNIVQYLTANGAGIDDIPSRSSDIDSTTWETPLMVAVRCGLRNIVDHLLESGARTTLRIHSISCPVLAYSARYGQKDILQYLIDHQFDVDEPDDEGNTALILAITMRNLECVPPLLDAGCSVETRNQRGSTALFEAIRNKHCDIVKAVLEKGAKPNDPGEDGKCTLDVAIQVQAHDIVQELVTAGATSAKSPNQYAPIRLLHAHTMEYQIFGIFDNAKIPLPAYATLYRSWTLDDISFQTLQSLNPDERADSNYFRMKFPRLEIAHAALRQIYKEASERHIDWVWLDSLCINAADNAETQATAKCLPWVFRRADACFFYMYESERLSLQANPGLDLVSRLRLWGLLQRSWSLQALLANKAQATFLRPDFALFGHS